jgi:F-type H+-transporting ATPase subunit a
MKLLKRIPLWAWLVIALAALAVLFVLPGGAKANFSVSNEFVLQPVIKLPKIGPVDLSITKGVIYLWIAVVVVCLFAALVNRSLKARPGRLQVALEGLYELARYGIAGSVMKEGSDVTWFPYIGGAFFFILVCNLCGLIPLPFGEHHQLSFYAATGNLNVTIALALCTFVFTQYAGIHKKGAVGYVKSWIIPSAPPVLKQLIFVMHIISEFFRLVSLSVRLFANMLAGHAILGVFFAMALVFQSYLIAVVLQAGSVTLYLFEIFIAAIQAFIFAILSAVYISSAIEDEE